MIEKWVKIEDSIFYLKNITIQQAIKNSFGYTNIYIEIDIAKYPSYENVFFSFVENRTKFNMFNKNVELKGCFIKMISISDDSLTIDINCDYINIKEISEIREETIDLIINNK